MSFFGLCPSKVPATVTAPPPIQPTSFAPAKSSLREILEKNNCEPVPGCPFALQLLVSLHKRIKSLPKDTKEAGTDHPLAIFSSDPTGCVEDGEDAWEKVISGGEVEEGEGFIECNKAGCETQWVSPCL